MSDPLEIYRRPNHLLVKASIIAWSDRNLPWRETEMAVFIANLNDLARTRYPITESAVVEVLEVVADMDAIDAGNYPFDTHCKDPERPFEEDNMRHSLDRQINALVGAMVS